MRLRALALLLFSAFLAGCYFEQPLTHTPSKDLNTWLLGVWEYKDEKGKVYRAGVMPLTGDRYTVWFHAIGKKPRDTKEWQFEAWASRVGNSTFLTFRCVKSAGEVPEAAYVFAHFQVMDQNTVVTRPLQLDAAQDTTSFKLRQEARRKAKDNTLLPEAGMAWRRVSEVYWQRDGDGQPQPFQPLRSPDGSHLRPLDFYTEPENL